MAFIAIPALSLINQSGRRVLERPQKGGVRIFFTRHSLPLALAAVSVVVIVVILVSPGNGFQFFIDPVAIK